MAEDNTIENVQPGLGVPEQPLPSTSYQALPEQYSLSDTISAAFDLGQEETLGNYLSKNLEFNEKGNQGAKLSADELNAHFEDSTHFFTEPMTLEQANFVVERERTLNNYGNILANGPGGISQATTNFVSMVFANALDPVEGTLSLLTSFGLTKMMSATRAGARAIELARTSRLRATALGAAEGVAEQAVYEPFIYAAKANIDEDYSITDAMTNMVVAAGFGGTIRALAHNVIAKPFERDIAESLGQIAEAQARMGRKIDYTIIEKDLALEGNRYREGVPDDIEVNEGNVLDNRNYFSYALESDSPVPGQHVEVDLGEGVFTLTDRKAVANGHAARKVYNRPGNVFTHTLDPNLRLLDGDAPAPKALGLGGKTLKQALRDATPEQKTEINSRVKSLGFDGYRLKGGLDAPAEFRLRDHNIVALVNQKKAKLQRSQAADRSVVYEPPKSEWEAFVKQQTDDPKTPEFETDPLPKNLKQDAELRTQEAIDLVPENQKPKVNEFIKESRERLSSLETIHKAALNCVIRNRGS